MQQGFPRAVLTSYQVEPALTLDRLHILVVQAKWSVRSRRALHGAKSVASSCLDADADKDAGEALWFILRLEHALQFDKTATLSRKRMVECKVEYFRCQISR